MPFDMKLIHKFILSYLGVSKDDFGKCLVNEKTSSCNGSGFILDNEQLRL